MRITFDNDYTKQWLARKGPAKVFGKDVDRRESLSDDEAIQWFDRIWKSTLESSVVGATPCDIEFVRSKVPHYAQNFINNSAQHREFTLANCFFICQFSDLQTCDQLWFIPSTSGDPRTLYVTFKTVPIKEEFDKLARRLGWQKPEELGEKVLLRFMESKTGKSYESRSEKELPD